MFSPRSVSTNQVGVHERLVEVVRRHLREPSRRPVAEHTREAFERVREWLSARERPLILDSGCGNGESTRIIAEKYSMCAVVGVDKSAYRLERKPRQWPENALLVRADLRDFWTLARLAGWRLCKNWLLYPNPWPKKAHLRRRWHAHPSFADLLALGGELELRTNWSLYAQEFVVALREAGYAPIVEENFESDGITPFERKYAKSGQVLYRVYCDLSHKSGGEIQAGFYSFV